MIPVAAWERNFCTKACKVPWSRILEAEKTYSAYLFYKKHLHGCNFLKGYKNVIEWDDSGSVDDFFIAKARYWAELNNLPYDKDVQLHDPNSWIDEIDWDAAIDPEYVSVDDALGGEFEEGEEQEDEKKWIFDGLFEFKLNQPIVCTGWDDNVDKVEKPVEIEKNHPSCYKKNIKKLQVSMSSYIATRSQETKGRKKVIIPHATRSRIEKKPCTTNQSCATSFCKGRIHWRG